VYFVATDTIGIACDMDYNGKTSDELVSPQTCVGTSINEIKTI